MIKIHTPEDFSTSVEILVLKNEISYIDAILQLIDENLIEMSVVPKLLTRSLRDKIEAQANDLKLLDRNFKQEKLPFL